MSSTAVNALVKKLESLPIEIQEQVAEHLREYIEDLEDEFKWNESFGRTQLKLVAAAQQAKREIVQGRATTMDYEQL